MKYVIYWRVKINEYTEAVNALIDKKTDLLALLAGLPKYSTTLLQIN